VLPAALAADVPSFVARLSIWFWPARPRALNQGPFDVDQDQGWQTVLFTTSSERPLRNPDSAWIGYAWEESGPPWRHEPDGDAGAAVDKISSLPFVDVLNFAVIGETFSHARGDLIRTSLATCAPTRLNQKGLRVAFRIQLRTSHSNPSKSRFQRFFANAFLSWKIREDSVGRDGEYHDLLRSPRVSKGHLAELNDLLAARFEAIPGSRVASTVIWRRGPHQRLPTLFPIIDRRANLRRDDRAPAQLRPGRKLRSPYNTQPTSECRKSERS